MLLSGRTHASAWPPLGGACILTPAIARQDAHFALPTGE